jgi:GxxExxY protein
MTENEVAAQIVDAAYLIHVELGPGLLESAYEAILCYELQQRGLNVKTQQPVALKYKDVHLDIGYRADRIVNDIVLVELKSIEDVAPVHK